MQRLRPRGCESDVAAKLKVIGVKKDVVEEGRSEALGRASERKGMPYGGFARIWRLCACTHTCTQALGQR